MVQRPINGYDPGRRRPLLCALSRNVIIRPCNCCSTVRTRGWSKVRDTTLNRVFIEDALHPPAVVQLGAVPTPVFMIRNVFPAETSPSRAT